MSYFIKGRRKIEIAEYCKNPMTFHEAIDYGLNKGLYVPNKRECKELGIFSFVWTSTAATPNTAYVNKIDEAQPMNQKRLVILIREIMKNEHEEEADRLIEGYKKIVNVEFTEERQLIKSTQCALNDVENTIKVLEKYEDGSYNILLELLGMYEVRDILKNKLK